MNYLSNLFLVILFFLSISAFGQLHEAIEISSDELPEAVFKTIKKLKGDIKVFSLPYELSDGREAFEIRQWSNNKQYRSFWKDDEKGCYLSGIVDEQGDMIVPVNYLDVIPLSKTKQYLLGRVSEKSKCLFGYYSQDFEELVKPQFEGLSSIDTITTFNPETFEETYTYEENTGIYFWVLEDEKAILICGQQKSAVYSWKGEELIPPVWDKISSLPNSKYFQVKKGAYTGIIDINNNTILAPEYQPLALIVPYEHENKRYFILSETINQFVVLNEQGVVISDTFSLITPIWEASVFCMTKDNNFDPKYALFDGHFQQKTPYTFDAAIDTIITFDPETFEEIVQVVIKGEPRLEILETAQLMILEVNTKKGVYNFEGEQVVAPLWDEIKWVKEKQLLELKKGREKKLVSKENKMVIPDKYLDCEYWLIDKAKEPMFILKNKEGKYGVCNSEKLLLPLEYEDVDACLNLPYLLVGKAMQDTTIYAVFDLNMKAKTDFEFMPQQDIIITFDPETFEEIVHVMAVPSLEDYDPKLDVDFTMILQKGALKGLYNYDLKPVLPHKFPVLEYRAGLIVAGEKGKLALYDVKGKQLTKAKYSAIRYSDDKEGNLFYWGYEGKEQAKIYEVLKK